MAAEFKFSLLENQNKLRIYVFRKVVDKITNWVTVQSKEGTVLFQGCHGQFLGSIKQTGLYFWKKSLLNNHYHLFFKF